MKTRRCMEMSNKTHWKKLFNPNYLGSWAFQPGEEKTLTIKSVEKEMVSNGEKKEECLVIHFEENEKPWIVNKTNGEMITKVWGTPYTEDWIGKRITLKVKKVKAFGDMVDAVRVSKDRPTDEIINCEKCGSPITAASGRNPQEIASATKTKYGKALCIKCAKEEKNNG